MRNKFQGGKGVRLRWMAGPPKRAAIYRYLASQDEHTKVDDGSCLGSWIK